MWPKGLNSYSSVLEIHDYAKSNRISKTMAQVRPTVKIAIIDDEKFQARPNLSSYGYDISEFPDLRSVSEVKDFDIIFCDLMGVGKNFDNVLGGASIIKEIKINYPNKYVIAYTGARSNSTEASSAKEYADEFLKKDAEITTWVERLDGAIEFASDPYERWLIARQGLIDAEVDIRRIVEFESAYVKSIQSKDSTFSDLKALLSRTDLGGNAKAIIQGLVSSAIYALIFGA